MAVLLEKFRILWPDYATKLLKKKALYIQDLLPVGKRRQVIHLEATLHCPLSVLRDGRSGETRDGSRVILSGKAKVLYCLVSFQKCLGILLLEDTACMDTAQALLLDVPDLVKIHGRCSLQFSMKSEHGSNCERAACPELPRYSVCQNCLCFELFVSNIHLTRSHL